jgi:hypothetical protein
MSLNTVSVRVPLPHKTLTQTHQVYGLCILASVLVKLWRYVIDSVYSAQPILLSNCTCV